MVSRADESVYKSQLRNSLSLRGMRSNYIDDGNAGNSPNYSRFLVDPRKNTSSYTPTLPVLVKHNGSVNAQRLCRKVALPVKSDGLDTWIRAQLVYINSLSVRQQEILASYTKIGDALLNNYLRGTLGDLRDMLLRRFAYLTCLAYFILDNYEVYVDAVKKFYKTDVNRLPSEDDLIARNGTINIVTFEAMLKENIDFFNNVKNITPLLEHYKLELSEIIFMSPRLTSDLIVYRGIRHENYLHGLEYYNPDFVSTSIVIYSAIPFAAMQLEHYGLAHEGPRYIGGVYEITVGPSIPCIYMESVTHCEDEFEVLLPPGLMIKFDKFIHYKILHMEFNKGIPTETGREVKVGVVHAKVEDPFYVATAAFREANVFFRPFGGPFGGGFKRKLKVKAKRRVTKKRNRR